MGTDQEIRGSFFILGITQQQRRSAFFHYERGEGAM